MAKNKNAFALRDFDETRILQRPFFNGLEIGGVKVFSDDMTDKEILLSIQETAIEHLLAGDFQTYQGGRKFLEMLLELLEKYRRERLAKHIQKKLLNFSMRLTDKLIEIEKNDTAEFDNIQQFSRRARKLSRKYLKIAEEISALEKEVQKTLKTLDRRQNEYHRKIFAQRLKLARQKKGLTQRDLSKETGINRATLGLYEVERKLPSLENFIKILQCVQTSADFLLGIEQD